MAVHAVHLADPRQQRGGELGRRHLAARQERRRLANAESYEVGHALTRLASK